MVDADALGEGDKRVIVRLRRQPGVVTAPGVAEGENVCDADVAGVEGPQLLGAGRCVGSGRSRDQAPTAGDDFHARYRLVASVMLGRLADEDALVARLHVVLAKHARPGHAELLEQQLSVFQSLVVAAHIGLG